MPMVIEKHTIGSFAQAERMIVEIELMAMEGRGGRVAIDGRGCGYCRLQVQRVHENHQKKRDNVQTHT